MMHERDPNSQISSTDILDELNRILDSRTFEGLTRQRELLRYLVTETVEGRARNLKAFTIAIDVFGRDQTFDQANDAIVRVQAARLRVALANYYEDEGRRNPIRITIPRGGYVPTFEAAVTVATLDQREPIIRTEVAQQELTPSAAVNIGSFQSAIRAATQPNTVESGSPPLRQYRVFEDWKIVAAVTTAALILFAFGNVLSGRFQPLNAERGSTIRLDSIAVLPFSGVDSSDDEKKIAAAFESHLVASLSTMTQNSIKLGPPLQDSRATSDELRALSKKLAVHWSLSGTVHSDHNLTNGHHIDLTFANALSGEIVWTGVFEIDPHGSFDPEKVAHRAIFEFHPVFLGQLRKEVGKLPPHKRAAQELFHISNWAWGDAQSSSIWEEQRLAFARQAVKKDPTYGPPYSVIADKIAFLSLIDPAWDTPAYQKEAEVSAAKAMELAPRDVETVFNEAFYYLHKGEFNTAQNYLRRTLELNPDHSMAALIDKFGIGIQSCSEYSDNALADLQAFSNSIATTNPIRWVPLSLLSRLNFLRGDFQAAAETGLQAQKIFENPIQSLWLAAALAKIGKTQEARAIYERLKRSWPGLSLSHFVTTTLPKQCRDPVKFTFVREVFGKLETAIR